MIDRSRPIAVIAPCGAYDPVRFAAGLAIARDRGLDLQPLDGLLQPHRYLAAPDEVRRRQLLQALTSDAYAAVWIARGGYGLTRLLDDLPLDGLAARPVIGFSDVTALFSAMRRRGLGPCVHAPVVHSLPITDASSLDALFALLTDEATDAAPTWEGVAWGAAGQVTAPVVGGNLCLLAATCGTPDQLDARGRLLFLEEVGEPAYRVDRMVQQLRSAGVFDGVVGVGLGELKDCRVPDGAAYSLDDILREHLLPLGVPVVAGLPFGHGAANRPFVWDRPVRLIGHEAPGEA